MNKTAQSIAQSYVETVNQGDAAGFAKLFADDAVVNDAGREFHGIEAIKKWAASDIFAVNVSLEVLDTAEQDGQSVLTAKVDGTFDRTGLPDPVIIEHRFTIADGKIVSLTCRLAK